MCRPGVALPPPPGAAPSCGLRPSSSLTRRRISGGRARREAVPPDVRKRVGFCLDTAHLHAVGSDLAHIERVWEEFDRLVGFELLKCLHLNDSRAAAGSRIDRHEWIAEGRIGAEPFRRIMRDPALAGGVKIIETPKRDDPLRHDPRMLRRLRAYARGNV